jgi:HAD superfamily hydrolase (TIGR01459 family)
MTQSLQIISGLGEIARDYDALICDVWGVLHNGHTPYLQAADALRRFKQNNGPVILLTNAPRPVSDLEVIFQRIGVPLDCYDAIVTSGVATRDDLAARSAGGRLKMLNIGPARDVGVYAGLPIDLAGVEDAQICLCTGPNDDETETPDDYAPLFAQMKARGVPMLCANPDIVVERGNKLIWCAGALAREYGKIGGEVIYYGKPHRPIYDAVYAAARNVCGHAIKKPLAIGDGADTDIKGANVMGIDALFIAQGVHAAQLGDLTVDGLAQLFAVPGVHAKAAMRALVW